MQLPPKKTSSPPPTQRVEQRSGPRPLPPTPSQSSGSSSSLLAVPVHTSPPATRSTSRSNPVVLPPQPTTSTGDFRSVLRKRAPDPPFWQAPAAPQPSPEQRFAHAGPGGGLLMRAVESPDMLSTLVESIPHATDTRSDLLKRRYMYEKYSHIRSDTWMKPFGGRTYGLLVDPHVMPAHALLKSPPKKDERPQFKFHVEDATSTTAEMPIPAGADHARAVPEALHALIQEHQAANRGGKEKWNEVEMLSAPPGAYQGLFHFGAEGDVKADASFDEKFPEATQKQLAALWHLKTGQESLKVYRYHRGQQPVGEEGASQLKLWKEFRRDPATGP